MTTATEGGPLCKCHLGSAATCPIHTQADFDAQHVTERRVTLVAVVDGEVYEGMTDAQIAKEIDREVVYRAGLQGVIEVVSDAAQVQVFRAVPRGVRLLRSGDYVTLSREYGENMAVATHGWDGNVHRDGDLLTARVARETVRPEPSDEDDPTDPMEWRYLGPDVAADVLIMGADRDD